MNDEIRLDIWLWRARLFKTRTLAAGFVQNGRVRLTHRGQTRRISKPATPVRPGDYLTLPLKQGMLDLEVIELGHRRGPAEEARQLYAVREPAPTLDKTAIDKTTTHKTTTHKSTADK